MIINNHTKIGRILKHKPEALESIISISSKFEKLRNPVLRKLMAGRTSIAMAAKVAGCSAQSFFKVLEPLGFVIEAAPSEEPVLHNQERVPFQVKPEKLVVLDVRPMLEKGDDPLKLIQSTIKQLKPDESLKIVNTFEPTPLIALLGNQGYQSYVNTIANDLVETFFYRNPEAPRQDSPEPELQKEGWDEVFWAFKDRLKEIDVRHLEMPQPMITILEAIDSLPDDMALYVYHKRIPVYLLPELKQRDLDYRIQEISDNEFHLLIFRN